MVESGDLGGAVWSIGKEEANKVLRGDGLGRAMVQCRQEDGVSAGSCARKEHKQRRGRRH